MCDTADGDVAELQRRVLWNECDAFAREVTDDGKERVVICTMERHAVPGDTDEEHYDEGLDIIWHYASEKEYE